MSRIALVPGCLALSPRYASAHDPVADLRAAVREAVAWLGDDVVVMAATDQGLCLAAELLAQCSAGASDQWSPTGHSSSASYLVVANGSGCRTEKAPGYLDERAAGFDEYLGQALRRPDPQALRSIDQQLAAELWASTGILPRLADLLEAGGLDADVAAETTAPAVRTESIDYDDAPYGVQYWVIRWLTQ